LMRCKRLYCSHFSFFFNHKLGIIVLLADAHRGCLACFHQKHLELPLSGHVIYPMLKVTRRIQYVQVKSSLTLRTNRIISVMYLPHSLYLTFQQLAHLFALVNAFSEILRRISDVPGCMYLAGPHQAIRMSPCWISPAVSQHCVILCPRTKIQ